MSNIPKKGSKAKVVFWFGLAFVSIVLLTISVQNQMRATDKYDEAMDDWRDDCRRLNAETADFNIRHPDMAPLSLTNCYK